MGALTEPAPATKVLFLDVDGILCHERSHLAYDTGKFYREWDPTCCALIRHLVSQRGVRIVVSSTWRHDESLKDLNPRLAKHRLTPYLCQPDWRTPNLGSPTGFSPWDTRGREISAWLDVHPEVEHYVIVDDVDAFFEEQQPHLCLVKDPEEGFGYKDFRRARLCLHVKIKRAAS